MELVEGVGEIEDVDRLVERLGEIGATYDCAITAVDARYVVGREHLRRAVALAERATERGENVAEARAIEVLLYVAGRRQIDRALEVGVSTGEGPIAVVVAHMGSDGERNEAANDEPGAEDPEREAAAAVRRALDPGFKRRAVLGEYDEALVRDFFGVGEAELAATDAALADLVIERVVLLDVEKSSRTRPSP